jgi:hypothetical protein
MFNFFKKLFSNTNESLQETSLNDNTGEIIDRSGGSNGTTVETVSKIKSARRRMYKPNSRD